MRAYGSSLKTYQWRWNKAHKYLSGADILEAIYNNLDYTHLQQVYKCIL